MSLPKLFERIFWHNNTTPAINEDNLNTMSKAIDDIDDRVIVLGNDVLEVVPQIQAYLEQAEDLVEALETLSTHPPYIGANGNWWVWDTSTEAFVDSGVDASITVDIADITMIAYGQTPYVTNTGTDTDPVFHLFLPAPSGINNIAKSGTSGLVDTYTITFDDSTTKTFNVTNGEDGVSPGISITTITGGHRVTITDAAHPQGQSFDVMDGQGGGSGDMLKSDYDSDSAVKNAGGIKAWVQSLGYITSLAWSALTGKPFDTIGNGLTVTNNVLKADVTDVQLNDIGSASATNVGAQALYLNYSATYSDIIKGSMYMEQTQVVSTSTDTTYTFTNSEIKSTSAIRVMADTWGIVPSNVVTTSGQCVVTIPKQSSAFSLGIRIYIM